MFYVDWKLLYVFSFAAFGISILLLPISIELGVLSVLFLVTIWSRVPGLILPIFNKLALNDLFTFIIAAKIGWIEGAVFGVLGILVARWFGDEWLPYSIRASAAVFAGAAAVPYIISITGAANIQALYLFEAALYTSYYILVVLFWSDEILLEIGLIPAVVFFDFFMNAWLLGIFEPTINAMIIYGISSGWPFILFSGLVLGFLLVAKNAKPIQVFLLGQWNRRILQMFKRGSLSLSEEEKLMELRKLFSNRQKAKRKLRELEGLEDNDAMHEHLKKIDVKLALIRNLREADRRRISGRSREEFMR